MSPAAKPTGAESIRAAVADQLAKERAERDPELQAQFDKFRADFGRKPEVKIGPAQRLWLRACESPDGMALVPTTVTDLGNNTHRVMPIERAA